MHQVNDSQAKDTPTLTVVLKGYPRLSETFIAQELRGLELKGFRLRLVSLRHPTDRTTHPINQEIDAPVSYLPEYLHHEPIRVVRSLAKSMTRVGFYSAAWRWLRDLTRDRSLSRIRRFGQACVLAAELPSETAYLYAHFIHTPAAVTAYASQISGRRWSCSAHAKDIWTSPDWELRQNLQETDWVATCTHVGWKQLRSLASDPSRVQLIYHGLDLSRFPSPSIQTDSSARDGSVSGNAVRLLSVGRAVEKKGFEYLLKALSRLPSDMHWSWTHIGGGTRLKALKKQASDLDIAKHITWRGALAQSEVLQAYRMSDLFVLPCRIANDGDRDGLPNVLVEAQSQRIACISTTVSAIPELIINNETGILVEPDDDVSLTRAIVKLAQNPEHRRKLAVAGEVRVRAAFDMHEGLATLSELFPNELRPTLARHQASQADFNLRNNELAE